jgi:hypothetical protein
MAGDHAVVAVALAIVIALAKAKAAAREISGVKPTRRPLAIPSTTR